MSKICFTCRKTDSTKFYNVGNSDNDKVSYLEKLKICVTNDLIETEVMEMCWLCIKHLRISYKFRLQVLASQDLLKQSESFETVSTDNYKVKDCLQSETECNYDNLSKIDYSSDDSYKDKEQIKKDTSSDKKYICEYCNAEYCKNWQLRKHLTRVHNNDVRKHVCDYCGKEFKQSFHLKEHITSHTGEKNYTCPICDKKFQRLSSQRRHLKSHDAPPGRKTKRTPFLCTICGKSFPFSNGVQRHMRIHLGIKNFQCKLCNRKFTQSTHLQVHMRTHTGEKPYICDTCGEKFSLKSCMLKHINSRHYRPTLVEEMPIFYFKDFEEQS